MAQNTDPDWEPAMRRVAAIVTDQGGRTAHAAIVSREFGIPCIVGTGNATSALTTGQEVTVCCAEGRKVMSIPAGCVSLSKQIDAASVPQTHTKIMLTVGDPGQAFKFAVIPNAGVGLARTEFIITNHIGIHPMALMPLPEAEGSKARSRRFGNESGMKTPEEFFIRRFSEGVATDCGGILSRSRSS